jgi:hypothetical protein
MSYARIILVLCLMIATGERRSRKKYESSLEWRSPRRTVRARIVHSGKLSRRLSPKGMPSHDRHPLGCCRTG